MIWRNFCALTHVHSVEKREIVSYRKNISPNQLLVKPLLSRNFCQKCVREISGNFHPWYCGNYRNLLSLKKNFIKWIMYLVISLLAKLLLSRNFYQNRVRVNFCPQCTVWKLREFTLTHFWKKFRESNSFTKEITK